VASRLISSWGNVIRAPHLIFGLHSRHDDFPVTPANTTVLPYGNGRSYGDSCLNVGGALLQTRSLDRFIHFDRATGVLACEAGVLLAEILQLVVPAGWFLPAVPGTCHVTVGGAIANDVHGKNHHRVGSFRLPSAALRAAALQWRAPDLLAGRESRVVRGDHRRSRAHGSHYLGGAAIAAHSRPASGCGKHPIRSPRRVLRALR
jgi:FAD/FMN-containing dehydrogenase